MITDLVDAVDLVKTRINDELVKKGTLKDVYLGDESLICTYPAAVVVADEEIIERSNVRMFQSIFKVTVIVYHKLIGKQQETDDIVLKRVKDVKNALHKDFDFPDSGGNAQIYQGYITNISHYFAIREEAMRKATTITWQGVSKETF